MKPRGTPTLTAFVLFWLLAGAACSLADGHPLDTLHRRLPRQGVVTQVTDYDGGPVVLTSDPAGLLLRVAADGTVNEAPTGLPGIQQLHQVGSVSVALAHGKAWRRADSPAWAEVTVPSGGSATPATIRAVNGEFWAWTFGGYEFSGGEAALRLAKLYRSADGLSWTEIAVTGAVPPTWLSYSDLEYAAGMYVLTGTAWGANASGQSISAGGLWTSADGFTWRWEDEVVGSFTSAAWGNGMWLAGAEGEHYATSTDGENWVTRSHPFISGWWGHEGGVFPSYSHLVDVVWTAAGFHALAEINLGTRIIAVSPDGISWGTSLPMTYDDFPDEANLVEIDGKVWLWGDDRTVWNSSDWRWESRRILPREPTDWRVVIASGEKVVILGANEGQARAGWSDNGSDWVFQDLPGESAVPAQGVWAADRNEFLAVGANGLTSGFRDGIRIWRSGNGKDWGTRTIYAESTPVGLVRGKGLYLLALENGSLFRSADGVEWRWTQYHEFFESSLALRALAFDGETFVIVSSKGLVFSSPDGIVWRPETALSAASQDIPSITVASGGGLWIASTGYHPSISGDLRSWNEVPSHSPSVGVDYAHGEFIETSGNGLTSSMDGYEWFSRGGAENGINDQSGFKNTWLLCGDNGLIYQSEPWRDFVEEWRHAVFSTVQLADPSISDDAADPDLDGVPNLLEYALGLNPLVSDSAGNLLQGRQAYGQTHGTEHFVTLRFPSWESSPGVRVWVETSTDLQTWHRSGMRVGHSWSGGRLPNGRQAAVRELPLAGPRAAWMRLHAERVSGP